MIFFSVNNLQKRADIQYEALSFILIPFPLGLFQGGNRHKRENLY